jgi:hypothetical protein
LIGQKIKVTVAIASAILAAFLIEGISYLIFPEKTPGGGIPLEVERSSLTNQVLWAVTWVGLISFIAVTIVGLLLLINRVRTRNRGITEECAELCCVGEAFTITGAAFWQSL